MNSFSWRTLTSCRIIGWTSVVFLVLVFAGVSKADDDIDFENSISKENCTHVLLNLVTPKGEITCEEMFTWSKCVVRVLGLHHEVPTQEDVNTFNDYLLQILHFVSLECSINIYEVFEALKAGTTTIEPEDPATVPTTTQRVYTSSTTTRTTFLPGKDCLDYSEVACADRENGNYPACFPACQKGVFISCSNFIAHIMNCADGWYQPKDKTPPEGRFTAPMVYNSFWDMCLPASGDCPRDYDSQIEEDK